MFVKINSRVYTYFLALENEFVLADKQNYLFDLEYLAALDVIGDNAKDFLQGQLTSDLNQVTEKRIQQGMICNLQGRILTLVDVLQLAPNHYRLILPQDLLADTEKSLSKVALLSRVQLIKANVKLLGYYLQIKPNINFNLSNRPLELITNNGDYAYNIKSNFYILLTSEASSLEIIEQFKNYYRGSLLWHYLQLKQKRIEIYPESKKLFLPHRLDLHKTDYISFTKGCYKGQEIIARTQYRAKLKHELRLLEITADSELYSGQQIFDANNQEIGEIIDFSPTPKTNKYLLATSIVFDCPNEVLLKGNAKLLEIKKVDV